MSGTVKNQTRIGRSRNVSIWLLSAAVMIMSGPNADGANQVQKVFQQSFDGNQVVRRMVSHEGQLYIAVGGITSDGQDVLKILRWEGLTKNDWVDVTPNWNTAPRTGTLAMASYKGMLFVGTSCGEVHCVVAKAAKPPMQQLGNSSISSMAIFSGQLYLVGDTLYRTSDGLLWEPLGTPLNLQPDEIREFDGELEVFGNSPAQLYFGFGYSKFQQKTKIELGIQLWRSKDGKDWTLFKKLAGKSPADAPQHVHAMEAFGSHLYIGGYDIWGATEVYRTDGTLGSWETSPVGGAVGSIAALQSHGGRLFAGSFLFYGNLAGCKLLYSSLDGKTWSAVPKVPPGTQLSSGIHCMSSHGGKLYFGTKDLANGGEVYELSLSPSLVQLAGSNKPKSQAVVNPKDLLPDLSRVPIEPKDSPATSLEEPNDRIDFSPLSAVSDASQASNRPDEEELASSAANQAPFGQPGECGLHGRVLALDHSGDIDGVVPGANIVFKNEGGRTVATIRADQRGYYKVHLLPGLYYYQVTASGFKDENANRGIQCQLMHGYAVLDFSLTPGQNNEAPESSEVIPVKIGLLEGIVLERKQDGRLVGVPGAEINFRGTGGNVQTGNVQTARVVTAPSRPDGTEAGQYRISLPADLWQASVTAPGFETWVDPTPIRIVAGQEHTRHFVLSRSYSQPLADDQGIKGVISIRAAQQPAPSPSRVKLAIHSIGTATDIVSPRNPDAQGNYEQNTPVGRYQVVADLEGFQTVRSRPRNVLSGRFTVIDLVLVPSVKSDVSPRKPQLHAEVYERTQDDVSGERPLEGATVLARIQGEPLSSATLGQSNEQGSVRFEVADAGTFELLARKEGYRVATTNVLVNHNAKNVAKLVLEKQSESMPAGELPESGLVVTAVVSERMDDDVGVRHLPGTEVFVLRGEQPPHPAAPHAVTDLRGEAEIEVPDAGEYHAVAHLPGYESAEAALIVSSQGENRVEILLRRMANGEANVPETQSSQSEPTPGEEPAPDLSAVAKAPLQIQVTGPRGDTLSGAEVAVHWGPEGQDRVVAKPMVSDNEGIARFQVPRESYWVSARLRDTEGREGVPANWNPSVPIRVVLEPEDLGFERPEPEPDPKDDWQVPEDDLEQANDGQAQEDTPPGIKVPLQIQVTELRGDKLSGAEVAIHWGPEGQDRVVTEPMFSDNEGMARFQVPRESYWVSARLRDREGREAVPANWNPSVPIRVVLEPEDLGFERPEPEPGPEDDWQVPEDDLEQANDGQAQDDASPAIKVPLQIQVTGPRGDRLSGAEVAVHWGRAGQDRVVAQPMVSDKAGMARFQVPRADYWVSARLGRVEGRAGVPRNWDQRRPIRVVVNAGGVDPDHFDQQKDTDGASSGSPKGAPVPLRIKVVGQRNHAIPGADVAIHWGREGRSRMMDQKKSEGNGVATFHLPRADYWITARLGTAQGRGGVDHRWNPENPIMVRLAVSDDKNGSSKPDIPKDKDGPRHVFLTVEVRSAQGNRPAVASADVHVFGPRESRYTGRTDRYGRYRVQLPPGQYRIRVSKPGYHPGSDSVAVGTSDVERVISLRGAIE